MCRIKELNKKYREVDAELADLYTMSEEAACDLYKVCDKEEAIHLLQQRLQAIDDEIEIIERGDTIGWADPAFRTEGDFDRMRI